MTVPLAWAMLILSGLIDVAWAYATKRSAGFTHWGWGLISLVLLALFITLLAKALQMLPLGTAYAVWTGIGALGAFIAGVILFGETLAPSRIAFAGLVIVGVLGLKLTSDQ